MGTPRCSGRIPPNEDPSICIPPERYFQHGPGSVWQKYNDDQKALREAAQAAQAKAKEMIDEAQRKQSEATTALMTDIKNQLRYSVDTIRTQAFDPDTGAALCRGVLRGETQKYGSYSSEIEYKVEVTSDQKLYVTILRAN
jgi:hypothetical protein